MHQQEEFIKAAEHKAFNKEHRSRMNEVTGKFIKDLEDSKEQFVNLELARERAAYYKWKVLENLDKYLIEFESNVIRKGGKVLWAIDAETARAEIDQIIERTNAQSVIKSKTIIGEEIGINPHLRGKNVEVHETEIGEYIVDAAGEASYHLAAPAIHKSTGDISRLLNDKIGVSINADPEEIFRDVRQELRNKFTQADIAITGANFLIADSGMVAISENEGSSRLCFSFVKTHIVLASIENVIPTLNELDILLPLLSTFGSGQQLTAYNSIVGPRNSDEQGPSEFIVILLDNGRSNLLAQGDQRQALSCITCGACSNVCPVYKTIGGHAYHTTFSGPIGSVITPHMHGLDEYKHLSYASTLCGKCSDICPVKIDISTHLLRNRRDAVNQKLIKGSDKLVWYSWKKMMLSRKNMNRGASVKTFMLKSFFKNSWGERREFPKVAEKSFNQLWRERHGQ